MYIYDGKVSHMHRRMCLWDYTGFHDLFLIYTLIAAAHCLLQACSFSKHNSFTYGPQVVPCIGETWFYFYIWDSVRGTHYEAKRMPSSFLRVCHLTYILSCVFTHNCHVWLHNLVISVIFIYKVWCVINWCYLDNYSVMFFVSYCRL
jgi:hypothetical protein